MTSPAPTCRPIATPDRREIACVPYPLSAGDRTLPKTVSFRRSLLTNLLAMVLLLAVAIFLMTALSSRRVVWSLSESLIEQASRRTELKLRGFFQPVERQTRGLRSLGESGMLDIDDPDQLRPLFQSLLGEYPSNSAVFVADDRGREDAFELAREDRLPVEVGDGLAGDLPRFDQRVRQPHRLEHLQRPGLDAPRR